MRRKRRRISQQGMTLIEISMVVVIAAMLVAAFVTYKNFQHASKLRAVVAEVSRIKTGVSEFRDKYFALPGDMTLASTYWPTASNGNGDGNIVWDSGAALPGPPYPFESVIAWQHLALAGIISGSYSGTCNNPVCTGTPGVNIPSSQYPNGGYFLDNADYTGVRNSIIFATAGRPGDPNNSILSPVDAESLDIKLDDAIPDSGAVQVFSNPNCATGTPVTYNNTSTAIFCQMIFRLVNF